MTNFEIIKNNNYKKFIKIIKKYKNKNIIIFDEDYNIYNLKYIFNNIYNILNNNYINNNNYIYIINNLNLYNICILNKKYNNIFKNLNNLFNFINK